MELDDGRIIAVASQPMAAGGWVVTHEDITERHRAMKELERTRNFLDTVIENVPVTILVKNATARGTQSRFSTEYLSHTQDENGVTTTVLDRLTAKLGIYPRIQGPLRGLSSQRLTGRVSFGAVGGSTVLATPETHYAFVVGEKSRLRSQLSSD